MNLQPITAAEIIINAAGDYNPRIWKERVNSYAKYPGTQFYMSDELTYNSNHFYAVYVITGIRFIQEISFSSCLDNRDLELIVIEDDGTVKHTDAWYPKTDNGRRLMRRMTELSDKAIFQ